MNALVIYYSKFGNTRILAERISETLKNGGESCAISSDELATEDLEGIDLVVMGSPTHKMNLPQSLPQLFDRLPKRILRGKQVAAFDTSYKMSKWLNLFTAGKRLARKLRKLGGKLVVRPEIFCVKEREGPLFEGEMERADEWAASILAQVGSGN